MHFGFQRKAQQNEAQKKYLNEYEKSIIQKKIMKKKKNNKKNEKGKAVE